MSMVLRGKNICRLCTDGHLYLFYFRYDQLTEFAVKLVDVIGSLGLVDKIHDGTRINIS